MKYFIMGGTGFVGSRLCSLLHQEGNEVYVLARSGSEHKVNKKATPVSGSALDAGEWQKKAAECDVIVNLVGKNIFRRWTREARKKILETRTISTQMAVQALERAPQPRTFLCANAVGYYGDQGDRTIDESANPGDDFLARVCVQWQEEAMQAKKSGHRVIITRFAAVLDKNEGALAQMLPAFKMGVGGRLGPGKQWFPWVHIQDLIHSISFLCSSGEAEGIYNICAPEKVTNKEFTRVLASTLHRPALVPVPRFALRLIFGDMSSMLTSSQKCAPEGISKLDFRFRHPGLRNALQDLLQAK